MKKGVLLIYKLLFYKIGAVYNISKYNFHIWRERINTYIFHFRKWTDDNLQNKEPTWNHS